LGSLCSRRDVVAVGRARSAGAAPRLAGLLFLGILCAFLLATDGRREDIERDGLAAAVRARLAILVVARLFGLLFFRIARTALAAAAVETLVAVTTVVALLALFAGTLLLAGFDHIVVTVVVIDILAALTPLIFEARAALAQHAEIVIGELQIIFGLYAVAGKLRVARHVLVLLEKLRGIAPLTIVLAVTRLSAEILSPLAPAAAPAATLSIVDQILRPYAV